MIDIRRIDIVIKVFLLSRYLAQSRFDNLSRSLYMFSFLKTNEFINLYYNPTKLNIKETITLTRQRVTNREKLVITMCPDIEELIQINIPFHLGRSIRINYFVDVYHVGDKRKRKRKRKSQICILIYSSMAPFIWYSKR